MAVLEAGTRASWQRVEAGTLECWQKSPAAIGCGGRQLSLRFPFTLRWLRCFPVHEINWQELETEGYVSGDGGTRGEGHVRVGKCRPPPMAAGGNVRSAPVYPPLAASASSEQDGWGMGG